MKAVAAFPAVCGEKGSIGQAASLTLEEVCKKELVVLFAHFAQDTGAHDATGTTTNGVTEEWRQGLAKLTETYCTVGGAGFGTAGCDYFSNNWSAAAYPRPNSSTQYFGRGAKQLSWNYNYGPFSRVMFND